MADKAKKPTPPKGLSEEAKAEWDRVVKELAKRGTITKADRSIIVVYVQNWDMNQRAAKELSQTGPVITWPHNGVTGISAYYKVMESTTRNIRRLLAELKLTPATRPKEEDDDELDI